MHGAVILNYYKYMISTDKKTCSLNDCDSIMEFHNKLDFSPDQDETDIKSGYKCTNTNCNCIESLNGSEKLFYYEPKDFSYKDSKAVSQWTKEAVEEKQKLHENSAIRV